MEPVAFRAAAAAAGFVVHSLGAALGGRSVNGGVAGGPAGVAAGRWFDQWSARRVTLTDPATMARVAARLRAVGPVADVLSGGTTRAPYLESL